MSSRERILSKLWQRRDKGEPFPTVSAPAVYRPMVPRGDTSAEALSAQFMQEALKAGCVLHEAGTAAEALAAVLEVVGDDKSVSAWDPALVPLPGLAEGLAAAQIEEVGQDAGVRVGITGVEAALAATGSVIVSSGNGRWRAASLLPPVHIAVLTTDQILPDLESWFEAQKAEGLEQMRQHSNVVIITGPSRTADIAMQLVMGMHGPRELHLVVIRQSSR